MNWEHTDYSMAPRAGRLDELRSQGVAGQELRDLMNERRSHRIHLIGAQFARGLKVVANLFAQHQTGEVLPTEPVSVAPIAH